MVETHLHGSLLLRIIQILGIVFVVHLAVILVRLGAKGLANLRPYKAPAKLRSVISLTSSTLVFLLYFTALGFLLKEFGISLTAYLASASVIGLAIGFGSQGLVQDVVTGLTILLTGLYDVGDMVEISGQTGLVRKIGMRFTVLESALGAEVFIPNRTIFNVIAYPRGYVRCLVDIAVPDDKMQKQQVLAMLKDHTHSFVKQFPGIFMKEPDIMEVDKFSPGKEIVRIKFRLWPGRGAVVESAFRQEIVAELKKIYTEYGEWMVTVSYEAEKKSV